MSDAMIDWISESIKLPKIGQAVLLITPGQGDAFWKIRSAQLLVRHEAVFPLPVKPGQGKWPTDYYWSLCHFGDHTCLVTGNGFWALMNGFPLPPKARHGSRNGYYFIEQHEDAFIPKHSTDNLPKK